MSVHVSQRDEVDYRVCLFNYVLIVKVERSVTKSTATTVCRDIMVVLPNISLCTC